MDEVKTGMIPAESTIQSRIMTVRGIQVMLDRDLAELYGVTTKALNQAVKRNKERSLKGSCSRSRRISSMNWSQNVTGSVR